MKIKFTIKPEFVEGGLTEDYHEIFSVDVTFDDGTVYIIEVSDEDTSYADFKADIYESLFLSLAESADIEVEIDEEDYAEVNLADIEDYRVDDEWKTGC